MYIKFSGKLVTIVNKDLYINSHKSRCVGEKTAC